MWTLACFNGVETVAFGFSVASRYSGPRHWEGATGWVSVDMLAVGDNRGIEGHVAGNSQYLLTSREQWFPSEFLCRPRAC